MIFDNKSNFICDYISKSLNLYIFISFDYSLNRYQKYKNHLTYKFKFSILFTYYYIKMKSILKYTFIIKYMQNNINTKITKIIYPNKPR
jgi:hypothetical protein